jgi:hypothetical protein
MNPPFKLWQPFLEKALGSGPFEGPDAVIVLLRLGALAGQRRQDFWNETRSQWNIRLNVLSKRPSFTGKGTDATDYAWVEIGGLKGERGLRWL